MAEKEFRNRKSMNQKLVIPKGYTLTVKSWENDGDASNTKTLTVATREEAQALYEMMQLCRSSNLGNTYEEFDSKQMRTIVDFAEKNPDLFGEEIEGDFEDDAEREECYADLFMEHAELLLGGSEHYRCRVMDSCIVTYSPEDIYAELIEF